MNGASPARRVPRPVDAANTASISSTARTGRSGGGAGTVLARAARHIGERDRWLLRMLHEHTVLTTTQLVRLRFAPAPRSTQLRLAQLHQLGILDRFQPQRTRGSWPVHHLIGPLGARVLAAEIGVEVGALGWRRDRAAAVAHRLSLAHDVATTDLICDLAADPGLHLDAWWSPARCRRVVGHHVRPDTYLALTTTDQTTGPGPAGPGERGGSGGGVGAGGRMWEMFVEYDTGTTALRVLAAKLRGYAALAAATRTVTPVGFWIARPGREPGARDALARAHHALPEPWAVPVFTATPPPAEHDPGPTPSTTGITAAGLSGPDGGIDPADGAGAAGWVWLPLRVRPGQVPRRYRLADLAAHRHGRDLTLAQATGADRDDPHGPHDPRGPGGRNPDGGADGADGDGLAYTGGRVELPAPSPYPPPPPPAPAPGRLGRTRSR